jgi:hypothetical protein
MKRFLPRVNFLLISEAVDARIDRLVMFQPTTNYYRSERPRRRTVTVAAAAPAIAKKATAAGMPLPVVVSVAVPPKPALMPPSGTASSVDSSVTGVSTVTCSLAGMVVGLAVEVAPADVVATDRAVVDAEEAVVVDAEEPNVVDAEDPEVVDAEEAVVVVAPAAVVVVCAEATPPTNKGARTSVEPKRNTLVLLCR